MDVDSDFSSDPQVGEMNGDAGDSMECEPERNPESAEKLKTDGNEAYKAKNYQLAVRLYSTAIDHAPDQASYYGNRSAAYMMLGHHQRALEDAQMAIKLDPNFVKGYLRAAKCHMMMGNPSLSTDYYDKVLMIQPGNSQAKEEKKQCESMIHYLTRAEQEFDKSKFRECIFSLDQCLAVSPSCTRFRTLKAEALAKHGRLDDAVVLCNDLLRENNNNSDAIYVKALALYYQDQTDKAHQFLMNVLKRDPDHKKAFQFRKRSKELLKKKEEGNTAYKSGSYQEAYEIYSDALQIDPYNRATNAKLYCNRALASQKLGKLTESIDDCTQAIELDEKYVKAYQRRATSYQLNEQHEECVRDWKKVMELDSTSENKRALKDAEKKLKMSQRKDYYKILGIEKDANDDQIKKAYRKKALLHHPDRHSTAEPEVREAEEVKFKDVSEAYSVLTDPKKRRRYDTGEDLEGGIDIDAADIFSTFFAGGSPFGGGPFGGGPFGFGGMPFTFSTDGGGNFFTTGYTH
ncbi:PREDICTED: dnaJ homolog subfamily C member 7-like [Amphimedon queenslandica]|uniref:J domain-containing protein n=1 Tax=Amphimedon queenslandica TaxID=400682 RepID=A0A1X7UD64_AMPQE|nr:PREDICTED: dnaJ homolog subfamily C member 7-like [Amphimedon queenslandica]|eukprot:XP_019854968.1 PREDICTED: dnaJ homolog subfamily C member 7-like [Amphimedon queenslandica]